jgi:hypothetical protein
MIPNRYPNRQSHSGGADQMVLTRGGYAGEPKGELGVSSCKNKISFINITHQRQLLSLVAKSNREGSGI